MSNILSICGSLRKGSYNRMVMNLLPRLAPAGMTIKEAPCFSEFPHFTGSMSRLRTNLRPCADIRETPSAVKQHCPGSYG
jgi:NAD(P)H-dependent FMN reductase